MNTFENDPKRDERYVLDIEGHEITWDSPTITFEDIAKAGKWGATDGVIEIDDENRERSLQPREIVQLKPGHSYAKKVRWKRGDTLFTDRLASELKLIQTKFPDSMMVDGWFLLPKYSTTNSGWNRANTSVAFQTAASYPGAAPYGMYVPAGLRFNGEMPANYQEPATNRPPFDGEWGIFSWLADDGFWIPAADVASGANLLKFAIGFGNRFLEGK